MTDDPVNLDEHRGMAAQRATDARRHRLRELQVYQTALRRRQEELEKLLLTAPAEAWQEAAAEAQSLIRLFAYAPESQDPRRRELIAHALDDLNRLCVSAKEQS